MTLKEIIEGALALPAEARDGYLVRVTEGDGARLKEAKALLAAALAAAEAGFMQSHDTVTMRDTRGESATAGMMIGPYRILQPIGEGGFGSVFMAEQRSPVSRMVALKIIKPGMDSRMVIARFEAERQALAMMDHPHIARVFDAGLSQDGRPYFVMELVKGRPVTEFCDANHLSVTERIGVFLQVCLAVQHAHQKGIIHRDLKPRNVLVSMLDGKPFVKVIDFGIAKALATKLTDLTLFTQFEQLIGTPQYMSPEQAVGYQDIDTRSDVYSLGVVLYELMTGTPPIGREQMQSMALEEIKRIIRDVEPPLPSTRLSQSAELLPSIAAARKVEPKRLGMLVRGELDWIVMKALDKDRGRRYQNVGELVEDLENHGKGMPIKAAPPSVVYQMRKVMRRHRVALTTGAVVFGVLVAGGAVSAWQAVRARRAEGTVSQQLVEVTEQRTAAEKAHGEAVKERDAAEAAQRRITRMASDQCVDNGMKAEFEGDAGLAMLWLARGLELDKGDAEREKADEMRLTLAYRLMPQPVDAPPKDMEAAWEYGAHVAQEREGLALVDGRTKKVIKLLFAGDGFDLRYSPNGKYVSMGFTNETTKTDKTRILENQTGREVSVLDGRSRYKLFSPNGDLIATCDEKEFSVWRVEGGSLVTSIKPIGINILFRFSPDNRFIAAIDSVTGTHILDAGTGKELFLVPGSAGFSEHSYHVPLLEPNCVEFCPDSKRVATAFPVAQIWDTSTWKPVTPAMGTADVVAFSPDGATLVTGKLYNWRTWDAAMGDLQSSFTQPGTARSAVYCADGSTLATHSDDYMGEKGRWVIRNSKDGTPTSWSLPALNEVHFNNDGMCVMDGRNIWDFRAQNPLWQRPSERGFYEYSPDGSIVLEETSDNKIRLLDAKTMASLIPPHQGLTDSWEGSEGRTKFTKGGERIYASGILFDTHTGAEILHPNLQGEKSDTKFFARSENGQYVLAAAEGMLRIWDVESGRPLGAALDLRKSELTHLELAQFSQDGRRLAFNFGVSAPFLWEVPSGKPISLEGMTPNENGFNYAPIMSKDGRYLIGVHQGKTLVWKTEDGRLVRKGMEGEEFKEFKAEGFGRQEKTLYGRTPGKRWEINLETGESRTWESNAIDFYANTSVHGDRIAEISDGVLDLRWLKDTSLIMHAHLFEAIGEGSSGNVAFSPDQKKVLVFGEKGAGMWNIEPLSLTPKQWKTLAMYMAGRDLTERGEVQGPWGWEYGYRGQLMSERPDLFKPLPEGNLPEVDARYRAAVKAQVAAAKTEVEKKALSEQLVAAAMMEGADGYNDQQVIVAAAALELDPSNVEAEEELAYGYMRTKRYAEALAILEQFKGYKYTSRDDVFGTRWAFSDADWFIKNGVNDPALKKIAAMFAATTQPSTRAAYAAATQRADTRPTTMQAK